MKLILYSAAAFLILFVSCKSTQPMTTYQPGEFDLQAHRGGRGWMPENTIPAMLDALGRGVTTLEMDAVITGDKQVVLSHEPFFNKEITTLPDGRYIDSNDIEHNIYQMDYALAKTYDVGLKPYPRFPKQQKIKASKPLLSDVFAAVKNYMMTAKRPFPYYNIETKTKPETDGIFHPKPAAFVDLLMKVIKDNDVEDHVIIQSFDPRTLQYLHQHYPAIKTALLVEANDPNSFRKQIKDLGFIPTIYSPDQSLVTANLIKEAHTLGMKIIPWTINEKEKIRQFKSMGVDGVITDYP